MSAIRKEDALDNLDEICKLRGCDTRFQSASKGISYLIFIPVMTMLLVCLGGITAYGLSAEKSLRERIESEKLERYQQVVNTQQGIEAKLNDIDHKISEALLGMAAKRGK